MAGKFPTHCIAQISEPETSGRQSEAIPVIRKIQGWRRTGSGNQLDEEVKLLCRDRQRVRREHSAVQPGQPGPAASVRKCQSENTEYQQGAKKDTGPYKL